METINHPNYSADPNGYNIHMDNGESKTYEPFSYRPLSLPKPIRLLKRLKSDSFKSQGSILNYFSIEEHSLDEAELKYVAISYCWGNSPERVPLVVNGSVLLATPNAWDALNYAEPSWLIWIDQICINQGDDIERSAQISLMHRIFSECWKCVVWLGPRDADTEAGLEFANSVAATIPEELPFDYTTAAMLGPTAVRDWLRGADGVDRLPPRGDPGWASLVHCLLKPWFTRLWIFQEAVLPSRGSVFLCSGRVMAELGKVHKVSILLNSSSTGYDGFQRGHRTLEYILKWNWRVRRGDQISLLSLLHATGALQCTYPQDHIYALLGLHSGSGPMESIEVDLSKSAQQVYTEVTVKLIKAEASLFVCTIASDRGHGKLKGLPSWVPDWSAASKNVPLHSAARPNFFSADKCRQPLFSDDGPSAILRAKGKQVDIVTGVVEGRLFILSAERLAEDMFNCFSWCLEQIVQFCPKESRQQLMLKVADAATAGGLCQSVGERCFDWSNELDQARLKRLFDVEEPIADAAEKEAFGQWLRDFTMQAALCFERRFAILEKNLLGLFPSNIQKSDIVVILHGLSVPAVLRPVDGHHMLVGACYVTGIMYGEQTTWEEAEAHEYYIH